jgi:4'-phosphopantetheinyl transferase
MAEISFVKFTGNRELDLKKFDYWLDRMPLQVREKVKRYYRWQDALNCLAGNVLLQQACYNAGLERSVLDNIRHNSYGKPYIVSDRGPSFNISHTDGIVVFASAESGQIGVDVEMQRAINVEEYMSQMVDEERHEILHSNDRSRAFFNYWTKKEAILKATGRGLSISLRSFVVRQDVTRVCDADWFITRLPVENPYIGFIATDYPVEQESVSVSEEDFFR